MITFTLHAHTLVLHFSFSIYVVLVTPLLVLVPLALFLPLDLNVQEGRWVGLEDVEVDVARDDLPGQEVRSVGLHVNRAKLRGTEFLGLAFSHLDNYL